MQPGAVPGARPSGGIGFKLIVVGGVVLLGGIFGTLVAEGVFGGGTTATAQTAPTSRSSNTPSTYQDAFDASFKKSCRQSAMRMGNASEGTVNSYCDCALSVFNQTHSMIKAATTCRQYIVR